MRERRGRVQTSNSHRRSATVRGVSSSHRGSAASKGHCPLPRLRQAGAAEAGWGPRVQLYHIATSSALLYLAPCGTAAFQFAWL